ncbi:MAG TPA: ferrous iron transport protein B, partial [Bacteroidetes bacterium]|nr:ferrous iron transport protein B [Bacteroidota bacterium]
QFYRLDVVFNELFSPLTALLGLPAVVGVTLVFGILRKELSLIMLVQALGTTNVPDVLSAQQIFVFTIFVVFYFPCVSTFAAMVREIGLRWSLFSAALTTALATVLGVTVRLLWPLFGL